VLKIGASIVQSLFLGATPQGVRGAEGVSMRVSFGGLGVVGVKVLVEGGGGLCGSDFCVAGSQAQH
jgi:hypothetical protein